MLLKLLNKLNGKKYILPIVIVVYYIFEFMAKKNILPDNISGVLKDSFLYVNRLVLFLAIGLIICITSRLVGKLKLFQNTKGLFSIIVALVTFIVITYIYTLNPFGASTLLNRFLYVEKALTINDFISNNEIHDFYLEDDSSLVSKNTDPWVVIYTDNYNLKSKDVKYINIDVESISKSENITEYYFFDYEDNVVDTDIIMLTPGNNILKIKRFPEIKCFRLDLTTEAFVSIKLNGVYINDSSTMLNENSKYIRFLNKYLIFIASLLMMFILGNTYSKKEKKSNIYNMELWVLGFTALAIALNTILLNSVISLILIIFIFFIYGFNTNYKEENSSVININLLYIAVSLVILLAGIRGMDMLVGLLTQTVQTEAIVNGWNILWSVLLATLAIGVFTADAKKIYPVSYVITVFMLYYVIHTVVFSVYNGLSGIDEILYFVEYDNWSTELLIYGLIIIGLFSFILSLAGRKFTTICVLLFTFISVSGNIIKLIYQGTYLKIADFVMIGELFGIMKSYIGNGGVIALALFLLVCALLIIYNIKKIYRFLKFDTKLSLSVSSTAVVFVLIANSLNGYSSLFTDNINLREPNNYSKEAMDSIVAPYRNDKTIGEENPDVILIMAESLFEVDKLPNISFNMDFTKNISDYKIADVISPRYGGGTAAVEFEALTGLSNYFFVDQMVAYNFYFSKNVPVNSLASEFKNNGYSTTAIHANTKDFYNRAMVYADMGFEEFYDIDSFDAKPEDLMNDGFTKDYLFFDKIIDKLENGAENKFIFGVTIEGHSPYTDKFDETDVKVKSDQLNESEIVTMEQFSQTVKDLDSEIQRLVKYIKNREKPTLLYIWGDHLPPMSAYSKLGYFTNESYEKYRVPLIAYSNYKDLSIENKEISPTVITTEILKNSNIKYNNYFDYIADIQKKYPVIHKQFTNNDGELNNYYAVIYDILYGKNYLLE